MKEKIKSRLYFDLFRFFKNNHSILLTNSEVEEIIYEVDKFNASRQIVQLSTLNEILSTDNEIDLMFPVINSSGTNLDGNAARREVLKEYNKMLAERLISNF